MLSKKTASIILTGKCPLARLYDHFSFRFHRRLNRGCRDVPFQVVRLPASCSKCMIIHRGLSFKSSSSVLPFPFLLSCAPRVGEGDEQAFDNVLTGDQIVWPRIVGRLISMVPTTMRTRPQADFFVSFSPKTIREKAMETRMLSLSMGTTTLASPSCKAL